MKNLKVIFSILIFSTLISCSKNNTKRSIQYMSDTDMYRPVPYEAYAANPNFKDGLSSQPPVKGTIARGQVPYDYPNTNEGYDAAKLKYKSPLDSTKINLKKGKNLYGIYCAICHGNKGDGQSILSEREKFNGVPNLKDREITEGSIYHVIMYGRGVMGSHASQLRDEERWQVVHYVQELKNELSK
ncbi:MAG: cytochrome c [Flavobacteriaceae bacterium]|nr:cytochrome c [Flavobacteriaceae bacterium]